MKKAVHDHIVVPAVETLGASKHTVKQITHQTEQNIERKITEYQNDFVHKKNIAEANLKQARNEAQTQAELDTAQRHLMKR